MSPTTCDQRDQRDQRRRTYLKVHIPLFPQNPWGASEKKNFRA